MNELKVELQCQKVSVFLSCFSCSSLSTPHLGQENVWSSCHGSVIYKYNFANEYIMLFIATVNNYQDRTTCASGVGSQCKN